MKRTRRRGCICKGVGLILAGLLFILISCPAQLLCAVAGGIVCALGGAESASALFRR